MVLSKDELLEVMQPVIDPEVGFSIVDMGLIYEAVHNEDGTVNVTMTLTTPMCPLGPQIADEVVATLEKHQDISKATLQWSFSPTWNPATMASDEVKWAMGIFS